MYWLTSSAVSMSQIVILKVPSVRKALNVPEIVKHPAQEASEEDTKGLFSKVKEREWTDSHVVHILYVQ